MGLGAFTVIELLAIVAVILILGLIVVPNKSGRPRQVGRQLACRNNLQQIGLAFKTWALDNKALFPAQALTNNGGVLEPHVATNAYVHFQVLSNELYSPRLLVCPADIGRTPVTNFARLANSNISYFVGLHAQSSMPQMFLSGDRNLTNGLPLTNNVLFLTTNRPVGWTHELHSPSGNIGLADGSVQQFTIMGLRGVAGERLLMP